MTSKFVFSIKITIHEFVFSLFLFNGLLFYETYWRWMWVIFLFVQQPKRGTKRETKRGTKRDTKTRHKTRYKTRHKTLCIRVVQLSSNVELVTRLALFSSITFEHDIKPHKNTYLLVSYCRTQTTPLVQIFHEGWYQMNKCLLSEILLIWMNVDVQVPSRTSL